MPVLVLAGDSELLKDERVSELKRGYGEYVRIHPEDPEKLDLIRSRIGNVGMFGRKILIDVVDLDSWKSKERKDLLKILEKVPDDVLIVLRSKKELKGFKSERFPLPKPWERDRWKDFARTIFKRYSLSISDDVLEYFLDMVGFDEYRIKSEVEKLSLFCEKDVGISDVDEVVHKGAELSVDELAFAISEMRFEDAHGMVPEILRNAEPILLVAVLSKHFIDLYRMKAKLETREKYSWPYISKASQELSIPSSKMARFLGFSFKGSKRKSINHMLVYDLETLERILKHLYTLDRLVKSSEEVEFHVHDFIENVRREIDVRNDREARVG